MEGSKCGVAKVYAKRDDVSAEWHSAAEAGWRLELVGTPRHGRKTRRGTHVEHDARNGESTGLHGQTAVILRRVEERRRGRYHGNVLAWSLFC